MTVSNEPIDDLVKMSSAPKVEKLIFGVDSKVRASAVLQNNLTEFEWVKRNKLYPAFWGRNIVGENALDQEEIDFLHYVGTQIALIYIASDKNTSEEQARIEAEKAINRARELEIPRGMAIFLDISEPNDIPYEYMRTYARTLLENGYTPGFKANTDAAVRFDYEFSRGTQNDNALFSQCLVWAVTPQLKEYHRITTSHAIRPDNWQPYAPSGITRRDIAIWQYGKNCHPIEDDNEHETTFNVDLIRNLDILLDKIF